MRYLNLDKPGSCTIKELKDISFQSLSNLNLSLHDILKIKAFDECLIVEIILTHFIKEKEEHIPDFYHYEGIIKGNLGETDEITKKTRY